MHAARASLYELQLKLDDWPDILPLLQSILKNTPSHHRAHNVPIIAFTGSPPSTPVNTFLHSQHGTPVMVMTRTIYIEKLQDYMAALQHTLAMSLQQNRQRARNDAEKGHLAKFMEGDFVLLARKTFHKAEKLCLRWRGPRRFVYALNDYVYAV